MALKKSPIELKQQYSTSSPSKGFKIVQLVTISLAQGLTAANDLIALGKMPANCRPVAIELIGGGLPAGSTATVGWLTDQAHADSNVVRTMPAENEMQSGVNVAANTATKVSTPSCLKMGVADYDRTIGVKLSADVPPGAASLTMLMEYASL